MLYRLAESQFLRMLAKFGGGTSSNITQIEYRVDPKLEKAFAKKQREYDKICEDKPNSKNVCRHTDLEEIAFTVVGCAAGADGKGKHECRLVFHGTKSTANIDNIMKEGFKLNKVGSATDSGYYGKNSNRQL